MLSRFCAVLLLFASLGAGRGTLDGLADALSERCKPVLGGGRDLDVLVAVSAPWPKLAGDLGELVAARLRSAGLRSVTAGAPPGNARTAGYERVVRLDVQLAGTRLRVSGAVQSFGSALWDEPAETRAHLFADAALDDELRAYGVTPSAAPPSGFAARSVSLGDAPLLALAVGDAEGDGRPLVVGVTAAEAIAWRIDGTRAVERFRWRFTGRPAPLHPRAEVATVAVEPGTLHAHASPFSDGVSRARSGIRPLRGYRLPGLDQPCDLAPGVDWFTAESCGAPDLPERFWSAAALRRGSSSALAAIVPASAGAGVLWLKPSGAPKPVRIESRTGAQVAVAALARGEVVAISEPATAGEPDALIIRALTAEAPILHRIDRLPAIRALAGGDTDGDGREEILAVVRDDATAKTDLWIVE
jgi:hypothetical protein